MYYQMLTGSVNIDTDAFFTRSYLSTVRGKSMKLFKPWAAPRILRWGTKQDSRAKRAKKNFVPPTFPNVGVQASKYQ